MSKSRLPVFIKKLKQKQVLIEFFVIFNILIIIPTIFSNNINYYYTNNILENEVKQSNATILKNMIYYINEKFEKLNNDIAIFSTNNNLNRLLYYNSKDNIQWSDFVEFEDNILELKNSHKMIEEVLIYFPYTDVLLSPAGMEYFGRYKFVEHNKDMWEKILTERSNFNILSTRKVSCNSSTDLHELRNLITVYTSFPYFYPARATLIAFINENYFKKIISNYSGVINSNYLIIDRDSNVITESGLGNIINEIDIKSVAQKVSVNKSGSFHMSIDQQELFITFETSSLNGWTYLSLVPIKEISGKSHYIKRIMLIVCVGFIFVGLFISVWLSGKMYKPISTLISYLNKVDKESEEKDEQTGLSEFAFITNKLNQIYSVNEILKKSLNAGMPFLLENLFYRIIKGNIYSDKEIFNELEKYGIELSEDTFVVVSVQIDFLNIKDNEKNQTTEYIDVRNKIKNIIYTMIKGNYCCYSVDTDINTISFIINFNGSAENKIIRNCESVKEFFNSDEYNLRLTIGIGSKCNDVTEVQKSCEESFEALGYRSVSGESQVIIYSNRMLSHYARYYDNNADLMGISNCLLSGEYNKAINLALNILDMCSKNNLIYETVNKLTERLMHTGLSILDVKGFSIEDTEIEEEYLNKRIDKFIYIEEYKQHIKQLYKYIGTLIDDKNSRKKEYVVNSIIEYIKKNYQRDIYLETIAKELGLSTNYVSHFFKKFAGVSFVNYLGRLRIEKAKELLISTDKTINQICSEVGFAHVHTFNRTFKKFERITPGRYREIGQCNTNETNMQLIKHVENMKEQ